MGEEHKNLKKMPGLGALELCSSFAERVGIVLATASGFVMLFSLLVGVATRWLPFMTSAIWSEESEKWLESSRGIVPQFIGDGKTISQDLYDKVPAIGQ